MDTIEPSGRRPKSVNPMRRDAPGAVSAMPSPTKMHHLHIFSGDNYDRMVEYYLRLFNAVVVQRADVNGLYLTFMSYDDHDHRIVILRQPGWKPRPEGAIGVSHLAFGYASLAELMFLYRRMREYGYDKPPYCVNHGNSTSLYWRDPDGNQVETMMDNFSPSETQDYKRHYQFSAAFGEMDEARFDPEKMLALFEAGTPDTTLLDREEVRRLVREGRL